MEGGGGGVGNGGRNNRKESNTSVRTVVSRCSATPESLKRRKSGARRQNRSDRGRNRTLRRHHLLTVLTGPLNTYF